MGDIFLGSDLKLDVSFDPGNGLTMDDVNFSCLFKFGNGKKYLVPKSGMVRIDEKNYLACIKTEETSRGNINCDITVDIPDGDFEDGIRKEVARCVIDSQIV